MPITKCFDKVRAYTHYEVMKKTKKKNCVQFVCDNRMTDQLVIFQFAYCKLCSIRIDLFAPKCDWKMPFIEYWEKKISIHLLVTVAQVPRFRTPFHEKYRSKLCNFLINCVCGVHNAFSFVNLLLLLFLPFLDLHNECSRIAVDSIHKLNGAVDDRFIVADLNWITSHTWNEHLYRVKIKRKNNRER